MERPTDSLFLRAEYFYNVASNIDEFDRHGGRTRMLIERYDGKPLHEHSHSESSFHWWNTVSTDTGCIFSAPPEQMIRYLEIGAQDIRLIIFCRWCRILSEW